MDATADFHDWEILLAPAGDPPTQKPSNLAGSDSEDGAIKADYFTLDSLALHPQTTEEAPSPVGSDNPSWVDPESNSRFLDQPRSDGPELGFWSDGSWDGKRSSLDSERGSEIGDRVESAGIGGEMDGGMEDDESPRSDRSVVVGKGVGGEGRVMVWWRLPFEAIKFFVFKVRPVWSMSIAVAMLGVFVLGRKLYKMRYRSRSIPIRISLDEKKASQLKVQASRLNEAFSIVKRVPVIRPSLPAGGLTPWPVLGFQ